MSKWSEKQEMRRQRKVEEAKARGDRVRMREVTDSVLRQHCFQDDSESTITLFATRLRHHGDYSCFDDEELKVYARQELAKWLRNRQRTLIRAEIQSLSGELERTPSLEQLLARLHTKSGVGNLDLAMVQNLLTKNTRKGTSQRRSKKQQASRRPASEDAMNRAISSGFESSRRRH